MSVGAFMVTINCQCSRESRNSQKLQFNWRIPEYDIDQVPIRSQILVDIVESCDSFFIDSSRLTSEV